MVHRKIVHIICLLFLLSSSPLRGERGGAGVTHLPGIYLGVGEHSLLLPKSGGNYGVEGLAGADYMLSANHFLFRVGAEFSVWHSVLPVPDMHAELPHSVDRNGYEFTYVYDITRRRDAYTALGAQVPLMLGAEFGRFHFLVGGKFIYRYTMPVSATMQVATYGDYPQFLDPFTGMSNHQYFDNATVNKREALNAQSANKHPFDIAVSAELGVRLFPSSSPYAGGQGVYLSAYADLGMLNYVHRTDAAPLVLPKSFSDREGEPNMVERLQVTPWLFSSSAPSAIVRNLSVGLKLTVRFPHAGRGKSYPCKCLQDTWTRRSFLDDF